MSPSTLHAARSPDADDPGIIRSPRLRLAPRAVPEVPELLTRLLADQQVLTAVDLFAKVHDAGTAPAQSKYYRDLIPLQAPRPGQQYAFEVDLDACTGCKACVTACHNLNGLEDGEAWRTVGLLHGGSHAVPAQQTITTSCHHCVDPACMSGCPVGAYEKNPITGIVKHLDDQCIGCGYCTLMCPYDAPKYSHAKGIVRKCDMCSDRLSGGEAPACVQACPNQAIRIGIIEQTTAIQASEAGNFLPGAPAPDHTIPTTVYRSSKPAPRNMLPADFYSVGPGHAHGPLVIMLVLTQFAVGAFLGDTLLAAFTGGSGTPRHALAHAVVHLLLAATALGAATLHLGRPQYAWRALLGLRTSWMSREILAFGVFAKAAALYAVSLAAAHAGEFPGKSVLQLMGPVARVIAVGAGSLGVLCSVMIYAATRRSHWRGTITGSRFFATTILLGTAATYVGAVLDGVAASDGRTMRALLAVVVTATSIKLAMEALSLRHHRDLRHSVMKRVALVTLQDLRVATMWRFITGFVGGIAIPVWILSVVTGRESAPAAGIRAGLAMLLLLLAGETLERSLFFRAAPSSRMPGGLS